MSNIKEYKYGAILSYFNVAISTISGFFITPYIIETIGISEFGLYQLIGSLLVYIGLFDFGLNGTTVRYLSMYQAKNDVQSESRYISSVCIIYTCIAFIILILGFHIENNFHLYFGEGLSDSEVTEAIQMFRIVYITTAVSMPGRISEGILRANEKFIFINLCSIVRYILKILLILWLLIDLDCALTIVIIDAALTFAFTLFTNIYCIIKHKILFTFRGIRMDYIFSLLSYSFWVFISCLVTSFQWQFGQISLGINTNTSLIALFSILVMISTYYGVFAGTINGILTPFIMQQAAVSNNDNQLCLKLYKISKFSVTGQLIVLSNFIIFGKHFIKHWLGADFIPIWIHCCVLMCITTVSLSFGPANSVLETRNKVKAKALLSLSCAGLGALSGFYLSKTYGLHGVIYPLYVSLVINILVMVLFYRNVFHFNIIFFLRHAYAKTITLYTPLTIFVFFLCYNLDFTWITLISSITIYTILLAIVAFLFILDRNERQVLLRNR